MGEEFTWTGLRSPIGGMGPNHVSSCLVRLDGVADGQSRFFGLAHEEIRVETVAHPVPLIFLERWIMG